jgi:hypothetical protein
MKADTNITITTAAIIASATAAALIAGCGSATKTVTKTVPGPTVTVPGPTVTKTVPGPTVTKTVPGPSVTQTAPASPAPASHAPAPAPAATTHTFSGHGDFNSPTFKVGSSVSITYSYTGNTSGFGGDNFIADLQSSSDIQSIANTIATQGGSTTTIYPDTSFGGSDMYYLSVTATGDWTFRITTTPGS